MVVGLWGMWSDTGVKEGLRTFYLLIFLFRAGLGSTLVVESEEFTNENDGILLDPFLHNNGMLP